MPERKLLITNIFPRFKTLSGAETFFLELVQKMELAGHRMLVLTRGISKECVPLVEVPERMRTLRIFGFLTGNHLFDSAMDAIGSVFLGFKARQSDADVVCVHGPAVFAIPVYKFLNPRRRPCVYYCYQPPEFAYNRTKETAIAYRPLGYLLPLVAPVFRVLDRWAAKQADAILVFSSDFQIRCKQIYNRATIEVVAPGVNDVLAVEARVQELRGMYLGEGTGPLLVTVNKLVPKKNVDLFLRLIWELKQDFPGVKGIVVGDGPQRKSLEKLANKLDLEENVVFAGFQQTRDDVRAYLRLADLYLFLEREVPFGLTPVEAGFQERPTLAFRSGGALDTVVDGVTGVLASSDLDEKGLAIICTKLLADPEQLAEMGRQAAKYASNFSWDACVDKFTQRMIEATQLKKTSDSF